MTIEETLFSTLSPLCSGRAYPDIAAQSVRDPHIVYSLVFEGSEDHLQGDPGLRHFRFQFDCWANSKSGALSLMESAKAAIRASTLSTIFLGRNPSDYDSETKLYRESLDFSIWQ